MENADLNPIPGNRKFGIAQGQPTPEQKKAGWERKRQAQAIMDTLMRYMHLTQAEFRDLIEKIKLHPEQYTVQDVLMSRYVSKTMYTDKLMLDWMDRNISKAPVEVNTDVTSGGKPITPILGGITADGIAEATKEIAGQNT